MTFREVYATEQSPQQKGARTRKANKRAAAKQGAATKRAEGKFTLKDAIAGRCEKDQIGTSI